MEERFIAPCGMNCALCYAFIREKNRCAGCLVPSEQKSNHCRNCSIKNCTLHAGADIILCYDCPKFPCLKIKRLDLRYRTKYHMSMIENLESIHLLGMSTFLEKEMARWTCASCGAIVSVHRETCPHCNQLVNFEKENR